MAVMTHLELLTIDVQCSRRALASVLAYPRSTTEQIKNAALRLKSAVSDLEDYTQTLTAARETLEASKNITVFGALVVEPTEKK